MKHVLRATLVSLCLASLPTWACPGGDCEGCKCPMSKKLQLDPERSAKLEALEAEYSKEREALHVAHKARLAGVLTPEEMAQLEAYPGKERPKKCGAKDAKEPSNKSPF
jgi:hypothetical protein